MFQMLIFVQVICDLVFHRFFLFVMMEMKIGYWHRWLGDKL